MSYLKAFFSSILFFSVLLVLPVSGFLGIELEQDRQLLELHESYRDLFPLSDEKTVRSMSYNEACLKHREDLKVLCQHYQELEIQKKITLITLLIVIIFPFSLLMGWLLSKADILRFPLLYRKLYLFLMLLAWCVVSVQILITADSVELTASSISPVVVWGGAVVAIILVSAQGLTVFFINRRKPSFIEGALLRRDQNPELWAAVDSTAREIKCDIPEVIIIGEAPGVYVDNAVYSDGDSYLTGRVIYISNKVISFLNAGEIYAVIYREMRNFKKLGTAEITMLDKEFEYQHQCMTPHNRFRKFAVEVTVLLFFSLLTYMCCRLFERHHNAYKRRREYIADMSSCMHVGKEYLVQGLVKVHCLGLTNCSRGGSHSVKEELRSFFRSSDASRHVDVYQRIARLPINLTQIRIQFS